MALAQRTVSAELLAELPPFSELAPSLIGIKKLLRVHLLLALFLYGAFLIVAAVDRTLWIPTGIGVLENPPFYSHLIATFASIPIVLWVANRVASTLKSTRLPSLPASFLVRLSTSRLAGAAYASAAMVGLASLAVAVAMDITVTTNIYDSTRHVATFSTYTAIRAYQYLFCYPVLFTVPPVLAVLYFSELHAAGAVYRPFAQDSVGGLRKHLEVFDRPLYAVQSTAVVVALANYIGWNGFTPVSLALGVGAPIVCTILAATVYASFFRLVRRLRATELAKIRDYQNTLYEALRSDGRGRLRTPIELIEELEANERLIALVKRKRDFGWIKYALNVTVALSPEVLKFILGPGLWFQTKILLDLPLQFSS